MILPSDYHSSNQQQSQADPLSLLPSLLILEDPTAFLTKCVEALQLIRDIQKEQAEARREVEAEKLSQAEMETEKCNRLVDLMMDYEYKVLRLRKEPYLKGKTYNELCAHMKKCYPTYLLNQI